LDHLQGSGALITCMIHLSVLPGFTEMDKWCELLAVVIILLTVAGLDGCQHLVVYPSPPFEPIWVMITVQGLMVWVVSVVEVTLAVIIYCFWVAPLLLACCGSLDALWVILLLDCQ
jgi:hypothetical protein